MAAADLVVCSHRGPFVFDEKPSGPTPRRGGGGLVGAVHPVLEHLGGTWIAAAMSDGDRAYARSGAADQGGFDLKLLDLPREVHDLHYTAVSNEHLWFLFHYLFDPATQPAFDDSFTKSWDAYRHVNEAFADAALAVGRTDAIFVQDYHLMLVGSLLRSRSRARRPIIYFHHTPWCEPDYLSMLPDAVAAEILRGMLDYDVVGFHAQRWADAFAACCERFVPGARASRTRVTAGRRQTRIVVAPVPLDTARLTDELADDRTRRWTQHHAEVRGDRKLLLRVDRIDLSKNPLRGFLAFEALLARRPALAKEVLFLALLYPSRLDVEAYTRYYAECTGVVRRINDRFAGEADDGPVLLHFEDDYHRSLGALRSYDALLVNPVFDGLNLVAKEGAFANARDGVVILSRNAGAFEEMAPGCLSVNPFDVGATAGAIEEALEMAPAQRAKLSRRARSISARSGPAEWVGKMLRAAGLKL